MSTIADREHWIKCALEEPPRACGFNADDFVQPDDFVQCGVGQMQECLSELRERDAKAHWYEAEITIRDQRIQELEEQVASLQRVIQHKRDSDSVVDA